MPEDVKFIEQLFLKLFDLLEQLRLSITTFTEQIKNRPCLLPTVEEDLEKCTACALMRLEAANKRLIFIVAGIILLVFITITGIAGGLGFFADQYGNQILEIIKGMYKIK